MADLTIRDRFKRAWNVFKARDDDPLEGTPPPIGSFSYGPINTDRPDRFRLRSSTERNYVASMYNRIATDVAAVKILHARVNSDGRYKSTIDSGLNRCLNLEANIDQTGRDFIFDAVLSMFDEGVVAMVPVDTSVSIRDNNIFDIHTMRTGRVTQWYPAHVTIDLYDDRDGLHKEVTLPKKSVAIIENPFYSVMNRPNSTLKRLINKLNLLDVIDDKNYSNKMDLILQLPYTIKTDARRKIAEDRIHTIEDQLTGSKYGIAYIDGTERITQLNRSIENKLFEQVEDLKKQLQNELGLTQAVFDGTADEKEMLNYQNSTIVPILSSITSELRRKFLSLTALSQGQDILYVTDPFKLVPVDNIAEIADKFTRNEVLSSNEIRSIIGMKPVEDPRADELRNKNLNISDAQLQTPIVTTQDEEEEGY